MKHLNRMLGTTSLILASLSVMNCAPKISQYKPDPEQILRVERSVQNEQKPPEPTPRKPWAPEFQELGMRDGDYYKECLTRLKDGTYVAFAVTMGKTTNETAEWEPINYKVLEINPNAVFDETKARSMSYYLNLLAREGAVAVVTCPPENNPDLQSLLRQFLADPDGFIRTRPGIVVNQIFD
ncbi:MAG: hypothetical protein AABW86_02630 [Candidatus Micrarchaeota archaeon]